MTALYELVRPKTWGQVVAQDGIIKTLNRIRQHSGTLGGHAYFISGPSGCGKTTIARLIAQEVAGHPIGITEVDGSDVNADFFAFVHDCYRFRSAVGASGQAYIVNEAHALRGPQITKLLQIIEGLPSYVVWVFTTTNAGAEKLFEDDDSGPLLSRCQPLPLARRDLCEAYATRVQEVARAHGLDGKPIAAYVRLLKDCRNNMRMALTRIANGEMAEGGDA